MHIACSIYVLIALSFLCTVLAQELGGDIDVVKLAKKVKKNIKNIRKLDTNLEDLSEEIADLGGKLNATTDDLNDLDEAVTGVEEKIEVFNGDVLKLDEKFTNADVEVEGKVSKINEEIADLGGQVDTTTDGLNDLDEAVTGLEEKIKLLEEALEVAPKGEEIQFFGVASQSTTYDNPDRTIDLVAINCIDGDRSQRPQTYCHTARGDTDPWWKLSFTNDVVINRIMVYCRNLPQFPGSRVSILSAAGNIVWEHTTEKEDKLVYVIDVPNIVGQYVKVDQPLNYVIMREVVVFGRYD